MAAAAASRFSASVAVQRITRPPGGLCPAVGIVIPIFWTGDAPLDIFKWLDIEGSRDFERLVWLLFFGFAYLGGVGEALAGRRKLTGGGSISWKP
jgi:hypothetical protein